jgi:hypothetical protein
MGIYYIYGYYEPDCANPFYIGKGKDMRYLVHFNSQEYNKGDMFHSKLRGMIAKGITPIIKILFSNLEENVALELEIMLIKKYGRRDIDSINGCLCNHTDGGEGTSGRIPSKETRKKMHESRYNYIQNDETIFKIRESNTKQKRSKLTKENFRRRNTLYKGYPIESYDLITLITIKKYDSISDAEKDGHDRGAISLVLKGKYDQHHGLGWRHQTKEPINSDCDNPDFFANKPFED